MSWLAGAAVGFAVMAARGPRGRPVRRVAAARGSPSPPSGAPGPVSGRWLGQARPRRRRGRRPGVPGPDLAALVTDVASRLRAGADPGTAWSAALGRPVDRAGPMVADLCRTADERPQAAAVVAADRLAADLGAPLAPLLDAVAEQLAAQAEADGERRAALAGPRATAAVLTGLPVLGVLLGVAVGADPFAVLLDGSVGSAALGVGVVLVVVGRGWTTRLARHAASAGRAP